MSSMLRSIKKNQEKQENKVKYGKTGKHRCPKCHQISLWIPDKHGKLKCVRCGD
ncbi:MAG: hypothetical protein J6K18_06100 [Bacilli bacterium]|nr:hypothetical protein [Bacilli bacterium]